jgi:two-component system, OmpR family, phosphate regulon response regulator PhoB
VRILIVDDDPEVRRLLAWRLEADGYNVTDAADARSALAEFQRSVPDLAILDLSLPDGSGLDVLSAIRARSTMPVIILSARSHEEDRVRGLELGADDYVVKPFSPREVSLRARRLLQGAQAAETPPLLTFPGLVIDAASRQVEADGRDVSLTAMEFDLLHFMARSPRTAFRKEDLLHAVWNSSSSWQSDATVTQHVHRLRRKIEADPHAPTRLLTVPGGRYLFEPGEPEDS